MNLLLWYPVCSFFSLTKTFVTNFALFLSTFPLESHCVCRSNTTYCDGSFRNHFFFHDLSPWNSRNSSNGMESTSIWFSLLCIGLSSNGVESISIWFSLLCIGLLLLLFAKWLWTNEILHNKILLYFIHFLWELTTCVVYNISTYEKLVVLESSKWARIPTSLQVLVIYIPCSPRFCHLL